MLKLALFLATKYHKSDDFNIPQFSAQASFGL